MNKFEVQAQCSSCDGSGLYSGMAERDGAAVVCSRCKGTGEITLTLEWKKFTGRKKPQERVRRVYECNPGIVIGEGNGNTLEEFGGMPFKRWDAGETFPAGSEMRKYTCPAWWYQSANYKKKPKL